MNRNNSDNNTEAVKIANALKPFAKKWFDEWGQSCVRSKKMTVSTPPNGSVIGVKDAFSDTEVFIKYMSSCSNADVGDTVWCKWMYDNMQTLYADEIGNLRQPTTVFDNSSSGNYAKVLTFSTNIQVGKNLLNDINPDVKNAYITGANKLGTSSADRVVIIPINPNTYYTFTWVRDAIEGASSDDTNVLLFAEYPVIGTTVGTSTGVNMGYSPAVRTFNSGSNLYAAIKIANTNKSNYQATLSASQLELGTASTAHEAYVNTSNINVNAPITIEYAKTGDVSPTTLTIVFNRDYSLNSFTNSASADAYLHNSSTAHWDLYIGKNNSSDAVNVLDFHNPWSNSDMTIDWKDTSVSTLPTGAVSVTQINTVITERGTTGSWRYRKWSDGRIEIWGVPRVTFTLTTVGGAGGIYHRGTFTFDLPFTLSDLEMIQMTAYNDTLWYSLGNFTNGKTVTGYGYDVVDASNYSTYVSVYVIGTI